jgi:hypothetical protein
MQSEFNAKAPRSKDARRAGQISKTRLTALAKPMGDFQEFNLDFRNPCAFVPGRLSVKNLRYRSGPTTDETRINA